MADKFKNKYNIASNRLKNYDYGDNDSYFVTICTKDRIHYFGAIVNNQNQCILMPSIIGQIANDYCTQIPIHYPFVCLDEFIIMSNHIHMIISIQKDENKDYTPNQYEPQSRNLSAIIRAYKASVKKYANQYNIPFEWQASYYEHIIRDICAYEHIRKYIQHNPNNWIADKFYTI